MTWGLHLSDVLLNVLLHAEVRSREVWFLSKGGYGTGLVG